MATAGSTAMYSTGSPRTVRTAHRASQVPTGNAETASTASGTRRSAGEAAATRAGRPRGVAR
jgi:hypothetical protein